MLPNAYADVAQTSLIASGGSKPPEMYIPLWWWSGSAATNTTATVYLQKGTTSTTSTLTGSAIKLHTLNSSWPSTQNYAFEVTIWHNSGNYTAYAKLTDITGGTATVITTVSTLATSATVLRSGQFTLTPGHVYAVSFYVDNSAATASICDASLIVFP